MGFVTWPSPSINAFLISVPCICVGVEMLSALEVEAKERQRLSEGRGKKGGPKSGEVKTGKSSEKADEIVGVGKTAVEEANKINKEHPLKRNTMPSAGGMYSSQMKSVKHYLYRVVGSVRGPATNKSRKTLKPSKQFWTCTWLVTRNRLLPMRLGWPKTQ